MPFLGGPLRKQCATFRHLDHTFPAFPLFLARSRHTNAQALGVVENR
jgi:hypothetical protein